VYCPCHPGVPHFFSSDRLLTGVLSGWHCFSLPWLGYTTCHRLPSGTWFPLPRLIPLQLPRRVTFRRHCGLFPPAAAREPTFFAPFAALNSVPFCRPVYGGCVLLTPTVFFFLEYTPRPGLLGPPPPFWFFWSRRQFRVLVSQVLGVPRFPPVGGFPLFFAWGGGSGNFPPPHHTVRPPCYPQHELHLPA